MLKKILHTCAVFIVMLFIVAGANLITCQAAESLDPGFSLASSVDDAPYAEYTNKRVATTDSLSIIKVVKDPYDQAEMLDSEFHFTIKINNNFYANKEFSLMNDYDGSRTDMGTATTDGNGGFTLKADQMATFKDIPIGATWYVEENLSASVGQYNCDVPAGGYISGTISSGGTSFAFINEYVPAPPIAYGRLQIFNEIWMPLGYKAPETPDFTFQLLLGGSPYANKVYAVLDENKQEIARRNTDSEGRFTLKGNQYAEFPEVELEQDYQVTELPREDEWVVLEDRNVYAGTLSATETDVIFTNLIRGFFVGKAMKIPDILSATSSFEMDDDASPEMISSTVPDADFSFTVESMSGSNVDLEYYLYSMGSSRDLVKPSKLTVRSSNPTFTLKASQGAFFCIPAKYKDIRFRITENPTSGFVCVQPKFPPFEYDCLPGKTKNDYLNDKSFFLFLNDELDYGSITVENTVWMPPTFEPPESPDFTFTLNVDGSPQADKEYTFYAEDGSELGTRRTNGSGNFTLKCGQKAVFKDIFEGSTYSITETAGNNGWVEVPSKRENAEGTVTSAGINVRFVNRFLSFGVSKEMDDKSENSTDFPFVLTRSDGTPMKDTQYYLYNSNTQLLVSPTPSVTDRNGQFTLRANQTALFLVKDPDLEYSVKELVPPGFEKTLPAEDVHTDTLSADEVHVQTFINKVKPLVMTIKKQDGAGNPLGGAKFKLTGRTALNTGFAVLNNVGDNNWVIQGWDTTGTEITTPADGTFSIQGLEEGEYVLEEIEAPAGYLPVPSILFSVTYVDNTPAISDENRTDAVFTGDFLKDNCLLTITDSKSSQITVIKELLMPITAVESPPETPEFTYKLTVDGEPWANKEYVISDSTSSNLGTGQTDDEGKFTLTSDKEATFHNIRVGAEYSVEEMPSDSYWLFSNGLYDSGVVDEDGVRAYIRNTIRGLEVEKQIDDGSTPDVDFTFVLLDSARKPMPSIKYYLFDVAAHKYLFDESHSTDSNGQFTLKAGQIACLAFPKSCGYILQELPAEDYEQISPAEDRTNGVVTDTSTHTHYTFVNAKKHNAITFVKINDADTPLEGVKFKLSRNSGQYAVLEEDADGVFVITDWNASGTEIVTDATGTFTIEGFEEGSYTIAETERLDDYYALTPVSFNVSGSSRTEHLEPKLVGPSRDDVSLVGTMKDENCTMTIINKTKIIIHFTIPNTGGSEKLITAMSVSIIVLWGILAGASILRKKKKR